MNIQFYILSIAIIIQSKNNQSNISITLIQKDKLDLFLLNNFHNYFHKDRYMLSKKNDILNKFNNKHTIS